MKKIVFLFCLAIFSIACNSEIEKPNDLIERQDMKRILKELYIYRQVKNFQPNQKPPYIAKMNLKILEKNNVSLEQFQNSFQYYLVNKAAYDEILDEIKEELEAELPQKDSTDIQSKKEFKPLSKDEKNQNKKLQAQ